MPVTQPVVAGKQPAVVTLKPGTFWWCRCGLSQKQPFCDGKHKSTDLLPMKLEISEIKEVALCLCKQTEDAPFCDGSHESL